MKGEYEEAQHTQAEHEVESMKGPAAKQVLEELEGEMHVGLDGVSE